MKRIVIVVLLISVLVLYAGYSMISGSNNNTGIVNAPDTTRTYKLLDNNTMNNVNGLTIEINNSKNYEEDSEEVKDNNEIVDTKAVNNKINLNNGIEDNNSIELAIDTVEEIQVDSETKTNEEQLERKRQILLSTDIVENKVLSDLNTSTDTDANINIVTNPVLDGKGPIIETDFPRKAAVNKAIQRVSLIEKIFIHRVKNGDNLWEIANKYDIDIDTLIGANDITNMNTIQIGDQIKILPIKGVLYKVNPGESLWTIARQFDVSMSEIAEANALNNPDLVKPGMSLVIPGAKPEFGYKDRLGKSFIKPINGRISSYYGPRWGKMHEGIDWAVPTGTEIRAARAGKVVYSEWSSGYGYTVVIEHQKGVRSLYAHNSRLLVHGGQWVDKGQVISLSGNTGRSTGPHLHFEIQINGKPVNPMNYISQ